MSRSLSNKWILVTGGAKHLGGALCLALAEKGHSVAVHYNQSEKEAHQIVSECRALGGEASAIQGDFSSIATVQEFLGRYLSEFPDTMALINNVGGYLIGATLKTSIDEWMHLFQLNLHVPFMLTQALAPLLIKNKGQVINIGTSGLRRQVANTYSSAYALTKEGLWGLTLSLARELAPEGVRVNMVSPGELEVSVDHVPLPMQRPAYYWEVARVVNFLLDPASAYITGQNIEVAGGLGLA